MQVTWIRSIYDLAGDTGASKTIWYGTEQFLTKGECFWKPESVFYLNSLFGSRKVSWIRSTGFLEGGSNFSKNRSVRYWPVFYCYVKMGEIFMVPGCVYYLFNLFGPRKRYWIHATC
jgi:hypothetical protein